MKLVIALLSSFALSTMVLACSDDEGDKPTSSSSSSGSSGSDDGDDGGEDPTPPQSSSGNTSSGSSGKTPPQCKKADERCTVDFDCCSGRCGSQSETCL
jgi:hypothetical protein